MTLPFPRHVSGLTPEWLSGVLGRDIRAVTTTRIGEDRGNLGDIFRLDFGGSEPLVAKFGSTRPNDLAAAKRSGLYEREVRFYQRLAPDLGVRVPNCDGAFYDSDTAHCLLLLEHIPTNVDLDSIAGIGPTRTAQVLAELAQLHLSGSHFTGETWLQDMRYEPRIGNLRLLIQQGWPGFSRLCADIVDPTFGNGLGNRLESMMLRMAELEQTIVHGDLKPDNLHATPDGIAILDWQAVGVGPPAWDVANAMVHCLTTEDRRAHESDLLGTYPLDLTGYEEALLFPLVVAVALTVIGDPNAQRRDHLVRATAERAIAAMGDHGVL
jgi:hypothetical protein